jgi:hypothetical protein
VVNTKPIQDAVSGWFKKTAGGDERPVMFDIDQTYPALRRLDHAYADIRSELEEVLKNRDVLPAYHDLDPDQADISNVTPNQWKIFYLWAMGERAEPNASKCPKTSALVAAIPNVFQAFFSIRSRRRRSGCATSGTRGRRSRASCSTTAGTTRLSTRARVSGSS